jgi:hypothetical protein
MTDRRRDNGVDGASVAEIVLLVGVLTVLALLTVVVATAS